MKKMRCPRCRGRVEIEDIVDTQDDIYRKMIVYRDTGYGHCTKCGVDIDFEAIYSFKTFTNVRVAQY